MVENIVGAAGIIGAGQVAASPGDGYTFAVVFDSHAVNPAMQPNLPFDTRKDLATVAMLGTSPMVISTHADTPYKTFADVVLAPEHLFRQWMDLIGHPITALLAALLLAFYTFGAAQGFNRQQIMKMLDQSLAPTAAIKVWCAWA